MKHNSYLMMFLAADKDSAVLTAPAPAVEVLRPFESVAKDFIFDGPKLRVRDGAKPTAADFEVVIEHEASAGMSSTSRSAYGYYEAGKAGAEILDKVRKALAVRLSPAALANIASLSKLIPLTINNDIKAPLTVLKDAIGALKAGEEIPMKNGKIIVGQLGKAGKALLPLLKSGEVTQAKVREIRKASEPTKLPAPTPAAGGRMDDDVKVEVLNRSLATVAESLKTLTLSGEDRVKAVNSVTAIARALGLTIGDQPKAPVHNVK